MGSAGPLSGAKCRPCVAKCKGSCVKEVGGRLERMWSWMDGREGEVELCDARGEWEEGWERAFDEAAGEEAAKVRRRVGRMRSEECFNGWEGIKRRVAGGGGSWEVPDVEVVCKVGLKT